MLPPRCPYGNTTFLEWTEASLQATLPAMRPGGTTPEELETLLEDASLMTDAGVLAQLFEDGAVVAGGNEVGEARGREDIERYAEAMCDHNCT
jgi:hypothetical protein